MYSACSTKLNKYAQRNKSSFLIFLLLYIFLLLQPQITAQLITLDEKMPS